MAIATCGPDCAFAEPLRGLDSDWLWCTRPGADNRIAHRARECRRFCPRLGFSPGFFRLTGFPGPAG